LRRLFDSHSRQHRTDPAAYQSRCDSWRSWWRSWRAALTVRCVTELAGEQQVSYFTGPWCLQEQNSHRAQSTHTKSAVPQCRSGPPSNCILACWQERLLRLLKVRSRLRYRASNAQTLVCHHRDLWQRFVDVCPSLNILPRFLLEAARSDPAKSISDSFDAHSSGAAMAWATPPAAAAAHDAPAASSAARS
jgi:hypothetical protein